MVGLPGWNVCKRDVFTLESQGTWGSKRSPVWLIGWVCSQSLDRLNHQDVPLQSSRVFSHWLLMTTPSSLRDCKKALLFFLFFGGYTVGQPVPNSKKKKKKARRSLWKSGRSLASKRNLDRGVCSAVKTQWVLAWIIQCLLEIGWCSMRAYRFPCQLKVPMMYCVWTHVSFWTLLGVKEAFIFILTSLSSLGLCRIKKKKNQFVSFFSHKRKQPVLAVVPGRSVTAVARLPADFLTNLAL